MKVNFSDNFAEIRRLMNPPRQGNSEPTEFSKLLGDLRAKSAQLVDTNEKNAKSSVLIKEPDQTSSAALKLPPLSVREVTVLAESLVADPGQQSVDNLTPPTTTPKLISARRVSSAKELLSMSAEERLEAVRKMVNDAGAKHGIDPLLGLAVAASESSFNPLAISSDGMMSKGLFQLLDTTGKEIHQQHGYQTPYNPFDPALNVDLGVGYLRRLHDLFSTTNVLTNNITTAPAANSTSLEKLAVAAFNAGEGRVASAQRRAERAGEDPANFAAVAPYLPESTQEYVSRVFQFREQFKSRFEFNQEVKRANT